MNNKIIIIGLLIVLSLQAVSQERSFRFGIKVAPNLSWIAPDSKGYENDGSVMGFSAGFVADIGLTDNYSIKTGVNYDYLNGKLIFPFKTEENVEGEMARKYNLRYVELPLAIKMRTNKFGDFAYYGEIGAGTAFNVRAKSQDEFMPSSGGQSVTSEEDVMDEIALVKETLIIGAGTEYFIDEATSLFASITFNAGLTNILTGDNSLTGEKKNAKLYHLQLSIGVLF
jgi:hypothetical protein